jgi:hypothetical protein
VWCIQVENKNERKQFNDALRPTGSQDHHIEHAEINKERKGVPGSRVCIQLHHAEETNNTKTKEWHLSSSCRAQERV